MKEFINKNLMIIVIIVLAIIITAFEVFFYIRANSPICGINQKRTFIGGSGWTCVDKDQNVVPF